MTDAEVVEKVKDLINEKYPLGMKVKYVASSKRTYTAEKLLKLV